jgi:hypothetical protein
MTSDIQLIHVVMWEPTDPHDTAPFEFVWSRDRNQAFRWKRDLLKSGDIATTVYTAALPMPTDGDFATDEQLTRSLHRILDAWPRNRRAPQDQALDGEVVFTNAARRSPLGLRP